MAKLNSSVYGHRGMSLAPRSLYLPIKYDLKIHGKIMDGFQDLPLDRQIAIRKDAVDWLDSMAQYTLVPLLKFIRGYVYTPGAELDLSGLVPNYDNVDDCGGLVDITSIEAWIELKYDPKQTLQKANDVVNATHSSALSITTSSTEDAITVFDQLWAILIEDLKSSLDKHFA